MDLDNNYYKRVLDTLYDGIYFLDDDKKIIYWNEGAERYTGYKHSEVLGRHCWDSILMPVNSQGVKLCNGSCPISQTIADGRRREIEVYIHHKEGHRVPISMRVAPIMGSNNQVIVAVEIFNENSPKFALHQKIEELQNLALLDSLVELGNRRYIEINLKGRLEELKRYGWQFGILFIDIDHFKNINDLYGHDIGDKVLKMVGKTILNSIRPFDVLGRWGGEEFIVILANINQDNLYSVANRFRLLVEQSNISNGTETICATVSIGATLALRDDTIKTLVKRADELMYQGKGSGRNCVTMNRDMQL